MVFVANRGYGLTSSRESLIKRFLSSGWEVVIASADDAESRSLQELGAILEPVLFNRGGLALTADLKSYIRLRQIYRKWKPSLIQNFQAKPVILGSLAARSVSGERVSVVNTITGLGHAFTAGGLAAKLAGLGYNIALPSADITIFQNHDDRALFREKNWLPEKKARLIASSGVNIKRFSMKRQTDPNGKAPVVVMISRLLKQKGIVEFVEVAKRIQEHQPDARFLLAGEEESGHPDSVPADWLRDQKEIKFLGRLTDVVPLLEQADLFLFPSYYREGVPRVVLEASAMGVPTVGLDVPGVREAVQDGTTGYLVKDRDLTVLTDRVVKLLSDESLRLRMGQAARMMIEASFDIRSIENQYLNVYRALGLRIS